MTERLINATREFATAATEASVVDVLNAVAASVALRVLAIWPIEVVNDLTTLGRYTVWGPDIKPAFRDEAQVLVNKFGPSALASWASSNPAPFVASETARHLKLRGDDRWLFTLWRKHGWRDGFYVPTGGWVVTYVSGGMLKGKVGHVGERLDRLVICGASEMAVAVLQQMKRVKPTPILSAAELAVLRHLSQGRERAAIAEHLGVHKSTVRVHLERALKKFKAKNAIHAVALAVRHRMI